MSRLAKFRRLLKRDTRGLALTEFALLVIPLLVVLMGAFDLGYQSYVRAVTQGVLNDVARTAAVESPQFGSTAGTVEARIEDELRERINGIARNATFSIEQTNFYRFSGVGRSEKLLTDVNNNGQYDQGDCWEDLNGNGSFDVSAGRTGRGGADDVVFYRVTVELPRLLPMANFIGVPDHYTINAQTAVRNQPYANQAQPATECG